MKLLSHNVYWFQGHPSRWGSEKVAEVPEVLDALTRLYAAADADLLCLQEVHRGDLAETVARELDMTAWQHAPGGLRPDYGGTVMSRQEARFQDRTRPEDRPPHERVHLRASLERNGARLEIAAVHLPSNRFARSAEAGDAARVAELERVLAGPDRPNLIAGDMNCPPGSPPYRFLLEAGYVDAAAAADSAVAREHRVDYIWLDSAHAGRLAGFAVLDSGAFCRVASDGTPWRLSDHPPLLMELR
jgi:endonuclease/exonuclease/phosphatase family metal-dependent hydrolase